MHLFVINICFRALSLYTCTCTCINMAYMYPFFKKVWAIVQDIFQKITTLKMAIVAQNNLFILNILIHEFNTVMHVHVQCMCMYMYV